MKKLLLSIIISLFLCTGVYAGPWISGGSGSGDVTAASTAQTWGDGTGPVVWTFSVTGTDPTISVATAAFTVNTDLALGANDITMTGSLGATGAGKLTKGWFTDLEITNSPTVNGTAISAIYAPLASPVFTTAITLPATITGGAAATWTLTDNQASGLSIGSTGKADIIKVVTTNSSEGVTMSGTLGVTGAITGTLTGTASGNIPNTLADAKGDLAVASANDTWGRLAVGATNTLLYVNSDTPAWLALGAANTVLTSNGSALAWASTHTHSDSAAQFYSATASKGTLKFDQTGIADTKTVTVKYTAADSYTYTPTFTGNTGVTFPTSGTLAVTSGALGTPSFTALNIPSGTGDAGTTAGQVVHDNNDTAGSANGNLEWYDGTNVRSVVDTGTTYTVITKTEFLPIAWAVNGATAPSSIAAVTGKEINARSFTEGDDVVFWWVVPNDYVGGIKYRVHYALSANASADETVIYSMAGSIVANSGDLDGSAGTALTITDELGTDDDQYQYMVTDYSAESNSDWSLTAGGLARLNFSNAAAGDLASGEPLVIGIEIKYKAKIIGFAGY